MDDGLKKWVLAELWRLKEMPLKLYYAFGDLPADFRIVYACSWSPHAGLK